MELENLVKKVKELSEVENITSRAQDIYALKKDYNYVNRMEANNYVETELINEFNKYYDIIASKVSSLNASTLDDKKAIIAKAKELLKTNDFKGATNSLNSLFNDFKNCGRLSKEQDDELWGEFNAVRDEFYALKKAHYDNVQVQLEANKLKKEELIVKCKEAAKGENFVETSKQMNNLMEEWKKVGFARKEDNERLWKEFNEVRNEFYDRKKEFDRKQQKVYEERQEAKKAIIKKAKVILANSEFEDEEVESIKALREDWKKIGFAGKEENALWEEFNNVVNKYFAGLREYRY